MTPLDRLPAAETSAHVTPAPAELRMRRDSLRGALAERSIDAALIAGPRDLLYFSGVICGGVLVVPVEGEPTLVAHRVAARVRPDVPFEVRSLKRRGDIRVALRAGLWTASASCGRGWVPISTRS